jgi:hypothetical protein
MVVALVTEALIDSVPPAAALLGAAVALVEKLGCTVAGGVGDGGAVGTSDGVAVASRLLVGVAVGMDPPAGSGIAPLA